MRFCPLAAFLLLLTAGCATSDSGAPRSEADPPIVQNQGETSKESMAPAEEAAALRTLIERSLTDPDVRESLELLTECRNETGMRAMRVWGDGLGVWQGRRQFHLAANQVVEVLERLHAARSHEA